MGLRYEPGPKLDWHLRDARRSGAAARAARRVPQHMDFQAEAHRRCCARDCRAERALIGFVGGPFTLYAYAVAGSHEGFARGGLAGLEDGLYDGFCEQLLRLLAANMALQARAGADCVALFDTAAGTLDPAQFARHAAAPLARSCAAISRRCPRHAADLLLARHRSRRTGARSSALDLQCLGVDWRHDLAATAARADAALVRAGQSRSASGCMLPAAELEARVREVFAAVRAAAGRDSRGLGLRTRSRRAAAHAGRQRAPGAAAPAGDVLRDTQPGASRALRQVRRGRPALHQLSDRAVLGAPHPTEAQWLAHLARGVRARSGAGRAPRSTCTCRSAARCARSAAATRASRARTRSSRRTSQAVLTELALYRERLGIERLELGELHLGGGTPTFLDPRGARRAARSDCLDAVIAAAGSRSCRSKSIRASPTPRSCELLARHGFRRISLGVQDFDPRVQDIVNRVQSVAQVREVTDAGARARLRQRQLRSHLRPAAADAGEHRADHGRGLPAAAGPHRALRLRARAVDQARPAALHRDRPARRARRSARSTSAGASGWRPRAIARSASIISRCEPTACGSAARRARCIAISWATPRRSRGRCWDWACRLDRRCRRRLRAERQGSAAYQERVARGELPIHRGHLLDDEDQVLRRHILNLMTRLETRWTRRPMRHRSWTTSPSGCAEFADDGLRGARARRLPGHRRGARIPAQHLHGLRCAPGAPQPRAARSAVQRGQNGLTTARSDDGHAPAAAPLR